MKGNVLVVDDEKLIRWSLKECLCDAEYEMTEAEDGESAFRALSSEIFDLALLDYRLPDLNGFEILKRIQSEQPETAVIMITAHSNVKDAVEAIQSGASNYLSKPFTNEDILPRVEKVLETSRLRREVRRLREDQWERYGFDRLIGNSPSMQKIFRVVDRVVQSPNTTILIEGESGTGKDVLAKAIHYGGSRADGPYLNITCTALPETLLESELFGHEKGAFTDAKTQKKGLFELANGGTVYLDEIGDMTGYLQGKILRFLEEKTFRRVGAEKDQRVEVRVIAATNRNLKELVAKKEFREYHWPGNIRELRNTIERAMILGTQEILTENDLPISE